MTKTRRQTTRVYRISPSCNVEIQKQWSMKHGQNVYRIANYPDDGRTVAMVPTFAEAKQIVRDLEA
jgi:hypothetical protein